MRICGGQETAFAQWCDLTRCTRRATAGFAGLRTRVNSNYKGVTREPRMSASHEWTEWHLTDSAWIRGSMKTDSTFTNVERPPNAIASFRYSEEISYVGRADEKVVQIWKSNCTADQLAQAIAACGECPRSLV